MRDDAGILVSELRHVVDDLQDLVGRHVTDAWVPSPTVVILGIGRGLLRIETWPLPRVHPVQRRPAQPKTPLSFQGLLRARFRGPVDRITMVGDDRVVEIAIGDLVLHARLMGRGGGIWLVDRDRVLAASDGPAPASLPTTAPRDLDPTPPRFTPEGDEGWAFAAATWFDARADAVARDTLAHALRKHLARMAKRQRRLLERLDGDLAASDDAPRLRDDADCLAAALHTIRPGSTEAVVDDLMHPGATRTIPLDPARPPADTMNAMYRRAGRLEAAGEQILERLEAARAELDALQADRDRLGDADLPTLRRMAKRWSLPDGPRRADTADPRGWWSWTGPSGQQIHVGKHDKGNHALVFRRSKGLDWWLHLRGRPSAHVVISMAQRDATPGLDLLLAAAEILLTTQRWPEDTPVDVQYARVRDVRPIKGAGPGQVTVTHEKVLHVTRDPSRLDGWSRT